MSLGTKIETTEVKGGIHIRSGNMIAVTGKVLCVLEYEGEKTVILITEKGSKLVIVDPEDCEKIG